MQNSLCHGEFLSARKPGSSATCAGCGASLSRAPGALRRQRLRAQGWALSEQQLALYYRGVAVPLRDRHGDVLGALSVTMPMGHESGEDAVRRVLYVRSETAQAMRNLI